MADYLTEKDVAGVLKLDPKTVRALFDEGRLSGYKWGAEWRTTEAMLTSDLEILIESNRAERLAEGAGRSVWDLTEDERRALRPRTTDAETR